MFVFLIPTNQIGIFVEICRIQRKEKNNTRVAYYEKIGLKWHILAVRVSSKNALHS